MRFLFELLATVADALRYGDIPGHWDAFQQARRSGWYPDDRDTGTHSVPYHLTTIEEA
jgi:hypothetical protein